MSLRDRFFTTRVADAMVSPSSLVAAVATGALMWALTSSILGAIFGAALGWAARVGVAVLSRRDGSAARERIDPFTLAEPWRRLLQQALSSRSRFGTVVRATAAGPTRDRLSSIASSVDATVDEAWQTAKAGHALAEALRDVDPTGANRRTDAPTADPTVDPTAEATRSARAARLEAARRMDHEVSRAKDQLTLLNARLDEAVTRCIELSVGSYRSDEFSVIETGLADVSHELEALRSALMMLPSPEIGQGPGQSATQ